MKLFWSSIFFLYGIHVSFALNEQLMKMLPIPKPGAILDILTKPKLPSFQLGSHFGTNAGGGSFGFGFGLGGQFGNGFGSSGTGSSVPPKEKQPVKPDVTWGESKEKAGPRPNWEEEKMPKYETHEKSKEDPRPDWENIGEIDQDPKSEYLMDGELVNDGLIQPRNKKHRSKRFIESKIYHVPLLFRSNAKPYQVKIHSNPNSLLQENSRK